MVTVRTYKINDVPLITENMKFCYGDHIRQHLFYLLSYVTCRSKKLGVVKKLVRRQTGEKCLHFCINEKLHIC